MTRDAQSEIKVSPEGFVGVVEIDRPPLNFFDVTLVDTLLTEMQSTGQTRIHSPHRMQRALSITMAFTSRQRVVSVKPVIAPTSLVLTSSTNLMQSRGATSMQ